jgi:hypothetical protein
MMYDMEYTWVKESGKARFDCRRYEVHQRAVIRRSP